MIHRTANKSRFTLATKEKLRFLLRQDKEARSIVRRRAEPRDTPLLAAAVRAACATWRAHSGAIALLCVRQHDEPGLG